MKDPTLEQIELYLSKIQGELMNVCYMFKRTMDIFASVKARREGESGRPADSNGLQNKP